jgi:hypothetical protein
MAFACVRMSAPSLWPLRAHVEVPNSPSCKSFEVYAIGQHVNAQIHTILVRKRTYARAKCMHNIRYFQSIILTMHVHA